MSKSYGDDIHIFYPQNNNEYYEEVNAVNVAWKWLIEACENPHKEFKKELRALLCTSSGKVHRIAFIIRRVTSNKNKDHEYIKAVLENAQLSLQEESRTK
jgi:flagellar biosynthesis regulator FlaF